MFRFDFLKRKKKDESLRSVLKSLERTEILLVPDEDDDVAYLDSSKIGGKPYLPADFWWPVYTSSDDQITRPLSFFCQIDLEEVKPYDRENLLPDYGMLYFFYECESFCWGYDPRDIGAAQVFWCDNRDDENFAPMEIPGEIDPLHVIPEIALHFKARNSYPDYEEFGIHSDLECDWADYDRLLEEKGALSDTDPEDHKLLGYADVIQDEMLTECERVSRGLCCAGPDCYKNTPEDVAADIAKHAADWTLLLQLSTITKGDFEWMFGDCGMLYFYIKKEDLAERRFDKVFFSLQCG